MLLENEFVVRAPAESLWSYLLDVERVAPCVPGAELSETIDDRNWRGKIDVRLGPISLSFAGTVTMHERDDEKYRVVLHAKGTEQKGKGAASATVTSWLEPDGADTAVKMLADIKLTGAVAQLSRGLLPEVSRKLTEQFAECLHASMLAAEDAAAQSTGVADVDGLVGSPRQPERLDSRESGRPDMSPAKPIPGLQLGMSAIWTAIVRWFQRLLRSLRS